MQFPYLCTEDRKSARESHQDSTELGVMGAARGCYEEVDKSDDGDAFDELGPWEGDTGRARERRRICA